MNKSSCVQVQALKLLAKSARLSDKRRKAPWQGPKALRRSRRRCRRRGAVKGAKRLAKDRRSLHRSALRTKDPCATLSSCEKGAEHLIKDQRSLHNSTQNMASTLHKRVSNKCAAGTLTASENPGECATSRTVAKQCCFLSGRAGGD